MTSILQKTGTALKTSYAQAAQSYQSSALRRSLRRAKGPVLIGPFYGEVGFECQYFVPWVNRLMKECGIESDRMIAISRSGAGSWYGAKTCVELYAMGRTPQQVRIENRVRAAKTGAMKQRDLCDFDRAIIRDVVETLQLKGHTLVHPSAFYRECEPFWKGEKGFRWISQRMGWNLPLATEAAPAGLPDHFVAVRFYARPTWPMSQDTTRFAEDCITKLAERSAVILLNTGQHMDEHVDFEMTHPNVSRLTDYATVTPENTLLLQSAVIRAAMGFVGNYGGLAQLALCLGKPSVSFYTDWQYTMLAHRHLSTELSVMSGVPFQVHRLSEVRLLNAVLPDAPFEQKQEAVTLAKPEVLETV